MTSILKIAPTSDEQKITEFFQLSAGEWRSQRRYYTLPQGETKEMVSMIAIQFLSQGDDELHKLAQLHHLENLDSLICGARVTWESHNPEQGTKGETIFGAWGNILYRDRGFATTKPVTAQYHFPELQTLCLRTEYNNSVFEEEIKLIGDKYRTRQTIISRANEQLMIGQYLEKRT